MADGFNFDSNQFDGWEDAILGLARILDRNFSQMEGKIHAMSAVLVVLLAMPQPEPVVRALEQAAKQLQSDFERLRPEGLEMCNSFMQKYLDAASGKFTSISDGVNPNVN